MRGWLLILATSWLCGCNQCELVVGHKGDSHGGAALGYAAGRYIALWTHTHDDTPTIAAAVVDDATGAVTEVDAPFASATFLPPQIVSGPAHHLVLGGGAPTAPRVILDKDGAIATTIEPYPETADVSPGPLSVVGIDGAFVLAYPDPMRADRLTLIRQSVLGPHTVTSVGLAAGGDVDVALVRGPSTLWVVVGNGDSVTAFRMTTDLVLDPTGFPISGGRLVAAASADDRLLVLQERAAHALAPDGTMVSTPFPDPVSPVSQLVAFPGAGYVVASASFDAFERMWLALDGHVVSATTLPASADRAYAASGARGAQLETSGTVPGDSKATTTVNVSRLGFGIDAETDRVELASGTSEPIFESGECPSSN